MTDFDPDAYLAKIQPKVQEDVPFDPDAYLAKIQAQQPAPAPAVGPTATTTATTPDASRVELLGQSKQRLRAQLAGDAADAFGYSALRGLTPGIDRFRGLGATIGEHLGATPQTPADPNASQQERADYLDKEAMATRDHPVASLAGGIVGGVPLSVALSPIGAGHRFAQAAGQGGLAGGLNTTSDNPLDIAKGVAGGAGSALAVEGTVGTGLRAAFRGAPKREENALIRDVMESDAGRATPTTGAKLARDIDDVRDVLKTNSEVAHAVKLPAEEARPIIKTQVEAARAGQPERYEVVDRALKRNPLTVTRLLSKLVDAEKDLPAADLPLVKRALLGMRDSIREDFAPRWSGNATWQGERVPISAQQLREWVSSAQATAERSMGGINGTNAFKVPQRVSQIANGILEERLDKAVGAGAKDAVEGIRESDRQVSALLNIDRALEDRGKKELARSVGLSGRLGQQSRSQELAAASGLAATGHLGPAIAVASAGPLKRALSAGARTINDSALAPLERLAQAGTPWATFVRQAAEQGVPQATARSVFDRVSAKPYVPTPIAPAATPLAPARTDADYSTSVDTGL